MDPINGFALPIFRGLDCSGVALVREGEAIGLSGRVTPPGTTGASFEDVSGSGSGPVVRMKSAKSDVVSIFGLASRGIIGLVWPMDDVDDVCN